VKKTMLVCNPWAFVVPGRLRDPSILNAPTRRKGSWKSVARAAESGRSAPPSAVARALWALGLVVALAPTFAVARPGTPNELRVQECGTYWDGVPRPGFGPPALCVQFWNTATESVRFEVELIRDGVPGWPAGLRIGCLTPRPPATAVSAPPRCTAADNLRSTATFARGGGSEGFFVAELDYDTNYCFRVRSRDDSDTVSELWSAQVCARTRAQPPAPAAPTVAVTFNPLHGTVTGQWQTVPSTWYTVQGSSSLNTLAGEVDRLVPAAAHESTASRPFTVGTVELTVPYGLAQAMDGEGYLLKVCAHTVSGTACSGWVSSLGDARPRSVQNAIVRQEVDATVASQTAAAGAASRQKAITQTVSQASVPTPSSGTPSHVPMAEAAAMTGRLTYSGDRCQSGFVWREANPEDHVCVTPEARTRTRQENQLAPTRRNAAGAYGPNTCISGYVWREAFEGDTVCVTPDVRQAVKEENHLGPSRRSGGS